MNEWINRLCLPWHRQFNRIETQTQADLFCIAWIFDYDRKAWIIRYDAIVSVDFLRCFHQKWINNQFIILKWFLHARYSTAIAAAVAVATALRFNISIHLQKKRKQIIEFLMKRNKKKWLQFEKSIKKTLKLAKKTQTPSIWMNITSHLQSVQCFPCLLLYIFNWKFPIASKKTAEP